MHLDNGTAEWSADAHRGKCIYACSNCSSRLLSLILCSEGTSTLHHTITSEDTKMTVRCCCLQFCYLPTPHTHFSQYSLHCPHHLISSHPPPSLLLLPPSPPSRPPPPPSHPPPPPSPSPHTHQVTIFITQAVLVGSIAQHFSLSSPSAEERRGVYIRAGALAAVTFLLSIVHTHNLHTGYLMGIRLRIITTSAIFQKVRIALMYFTIPSSMSLNN